MKKGRQERKSKMSGVGQHGLEKTICGFSLYVQGRERKVFVTLGIKGKQKKTKKTQNKKENIKEENKAKCI